MMAPDTHAGAARAGGALVESFIDECRRAERQSTELADLVLSIAGRMRGLLAEAPRFLTPAHRRADPAHYARNAVHISPGNGISLFALVWQPGQWTPVHDHGTWGVVGVVEGVLQERNYSRTDGHHGRASGIELRRGGITLLAPGSVSTFVPNPDHIHVTGVPDDAPPVLSLHLYGREMNSFNIYDADAGTRRLIQVAYEV
ncbi:MAG: cysteine dioxygenase [Alphaproteobacteria bacterium]|nr:cysteine dioxygenase [Alphaproteobacteria bacterium]